MTGNGNGKKKSRRRLVLAGIAGVVLLGVVGLVSASRGHEGIDSSKLAAIEKGDIARSVVATGKIEPLSKVQVKSKASGIVKEIRVEYGDPVRKGQVLVDLDKEELSARVREARAVLMSNQAALQRTEVQALGPDLPFLKSAMDRARRLFADGLIADSVREEAEKNHEMALNLQRAAHSNVAVNRAEVARAQAALERAETDLQNSTITSPMDGIVLSRDVEVGDAVSSILVMGSDRKSVV